MHPWRFTPYPYGHRIGYNHTADYTEGTLNIDAIGTKTNMLIWRGSLADVIGGPENLNKKALKAVREIFDAFPVKEQRSAMELSDPGAITRI